MAWAILDTNVYVRHWQGALAADALRAIESTFVVRQSAVVLSELRRGARTREARRLVAALHELAATCWEPTAADWWYAGELIRSVGDERGWETSKRREFQNDALIALTARRYGAAVVTANRGDFELLADRLAIRVVAVR